MNDNMLQAWEDIDWTDQTAHLLIGCAITFTLGYFISWWAGVVVSMTVAVIREWVQHPGQCRAGCRTDLVFWASGSLMAMPLFLLF